MSEAVRRLIPPRSLQEAEMLAKAGTFVVDLMPGPGEIGRHAEELGVDRSEVTAHVIRTLAMTGSEEAWDKIEKFADTNRGMVIDELLRAWRGFDHSERYARNLLSRLAVEELHLHTVGSHAGLRAPDLSTLTGAPLQRLSIRHPALRDGLGALSADLPLTELVLDDRWGYRSLQGIERFPKLTRLALRGIPGADEVRLLAELPQLRLLAIRDAAPAADLARLSPLTGVTFDLFDVTDEEATRTALEGSDFVIHSP